MLLTFTIQSIRLDSNTIVADVHSGGYDVVMRYDREAFEEYENKKSTTNWANYWGMLSVNDRSAKLDLKNYISQSPYLLSSLRDAIRLKEIEAVLYDRNRLSELLISESSCDHLHSLITQYGDGRVETELLKVKN